MNKQRYMDLSVGVFMLFSLLALLILVMKVSGSVEFLSNRGYQISANFTDIGGLRVRAPVTVSGVRVGEVTRIELQKGGYDAKVIMKISAKNQIPYEDTSARILTEGLIGSNYISIVPGFIEVNSAHAYLRNGDVIAKTQQAVILENLIGQLLFNIKK